jgi:hypothetical protein
MLTLADREEISRGLAEGLEYKRIALLISRNPSVVARHGRPGTVPGGHRGPERRGLPSAAEGVRGRPVAAGAGGRHRVAQGRLVAGVDRGPVAA